MPPLRVLITTVMAHSSAALLTHDFSAPGGPYINPVCIYNCLEHISKPAAFYNGETQIVEGSKQRLALVYGKVGVRLRHVA